MKNSVFLLLVLPLLCLPLQISAQSADIQFIRDHYNKVQSQIDLGSGEEEGGYYCNKLTENVNNRSWRAVGLYHKVVEFWYDDTPGMMCEEEEYGGEEACHLQLVKEQANISFGGWAAEYLYHNGKLIFVFITHEGGERRFYWKEGELIRVQVDREILKTVSTDYQEEAQDQWKSGMEFRKKYIALFQ